MSALSHLRWKLVAHFAMLDLVPPFNKVLHNIENDGTVDCHMYLDPHVSLCRKKELLTDTRRATACGEFPALKLFRSQNCSHRGSL